MNNRQLSVLSFASWILVWAFWLSMTYRFHPTMLLAVIVTTSLVAAFAAAVYCNHILLIPRLLRRNRTSRYLVSLLAVMAILTACALAVIRASYVSLLGPDTDPYGLVKHYAIDLFGMVVHVTVAAIIARVFTLLPKRPAVR